jgi:antitoxin YefM
MDPVDLYTVLFSVYYENRLKAQTTYTQAKTNLAKLCDQVADNRDVVIIKRRKGGDVALIAADELASILETLHLLSSPKNRDRLLSALKDARARKTG